METDDILKFETEQEKETARKIIRHLITVVKMTEQLPQGDEKFNDACITGMKQLVWGLIQHLDNPEEQAFFEELLGLEEMIKKTIGEDSYKMMKKHEKQV